MMRNLKILISACVLGITCAAVTVASAQTLTFEEFKPACDANVPYGWTSSISQNYGGSEWDGLAAMDATNKYNGNGYHKATVSGDIVAYCTGFCGEHSTGSISSTSGFSLSSVHLTSASWDTEDITAYAYRGGKLVGSQTDTIYTSKPTLVAYGFGAADEIVWATSDYGAGFAMDNVISNLVPEPSSLVILIFGSSSLCAFAMRRRIT